MTPSASLSLVLSQINDVGESPAKTLSEVLALSGFTDITPGRRILLAAAAADQAVTFTDAIGILIFSHDYPFSLRVTAGQTLLEGLRCFLVWAHAEDVGIHQTSVLLTGGGTYPSDLEVWTIEAT